MEQIRERDGWRINGFVMFVVELGLIASCILLFRQVAITQNDAFLGPLGLAILAAFVFALIAPGFFIVQPNEAKVLVFLGRYVGSVAASGFWWTNPFTVKRHVSLRVRNFNGERLKVNDAAGNPIEIAAVVVWRVVDSAKALFDVDSYEAFVAIQSETAIRALASRYPYDAHEEDAESLRGNPDQIAAGLRREVQARLDVAGVEVMETRITHLAYAPEIAQVMLRRQAAQAIIAARQKIVEGAVGMVEMALRKLSEHQIIELDDERKAAMINNLLVALVSEQQAQPIINTGTLYS